MNRLSPRVYNSAPANLVDPEGNEHSAKLKNIGLGGAYVASNKTSSRSLIDSSSLCRLKLSPFGREELTLTGRVVWRDRQGLGLRFSNMGRADLLKIWDYIRKYLITGEICPYCGQSCETPDGTCTHCGWGLNFRDEDYLVYWEKESLIRQLHGRLHDLNENDLRNVYRYIQKEVFLKKEESPGDEIAEFVGTCPTIKDVFTLIRKVAPTDLPVLILGESGTGKDLTARAIHERSPRRDKPYVAINCAAIPGSLIEAELFGYEKGAFTGAYQAKQGKFEYADGGTLFLDEIGELPRSLQPKLSRFLETQLIERIGSVKSKRVDVRIIAATNLDLERAVTTSNFRPDLYHRIKVFTIHLPPLRDRGEDKIILAKFFLKRIIEEGNWTCEGFTSQALDRIREHSWPGNVREMINRIRRAVVVQEGWIRPSDLELHPIHASEQKQPFKEAALKLKKEMVLSALQEHDYNISQSARSLGISRPYLYALIKKLDIQLDR